MFGGRLTIAIHRGLLALAAALLFSAVAAACGSGGDGSNASSARDSLIAFEISSGDASSGTLDVYLAHPDGTGRRRLTNAGDGSDPAWSPDGRKIAFSCAGPTKGMGVCVINADGSGRHLVTPQAAFIPAWSPDGKTIAAHCGFQICLFSPDGKNFRTLTHVEGEEIFSDPVWSPDSKSIAVFQRGELGARTMVVNAADGKMDAVAHDAEIAGWTSDGQLVLVGPERDGAPTFYAVDSDGSDKHPVAASERIVGPLWSPDGKHWLKSGAPDGVELLPRKLFVVDRHGKTTGTVVSLGKDSYVLASAWQPAP